MKKKKRIPKKSNPEGRPPFYKTAAELENKIRKYFNTEAYVDVGLTRAKKSKSTLRKYSPTISGLALFCGFADRHSLYEYEAKPEFTHTIKRARALMSVYYERLLSGSNCTGAIFALKNFGWVDKIETELSGEIKFTQMPAVKLGGKKLELKIG